MIIIFGCNIFNVDVNAGEKYLEKEQVTLELKQAQAQF
jgi:hypothetical protein